MVQTLEAKQTKTQSEAVLTVKGLSKRFGQVLAVEQVDLQVHRGEIFGFLGPNGAGKTTTLGMILGLVQPSSGEITLLGQGIQPGYTQALRKVGALLGAPAIYPHLSARKHLELLSGYERNINTDRIEEILELVGLSKSAHRNAGSYSTGMKQRLGIAMALLHKPELLILDEPSNGMDPAGMKEMRELMRILAAQDITIIFSSHILSEVEQVCDRIAVIHKGKLVAQGEVKQLLSKGETIRVKVDSPAEASLILNGLAKDVQVSGEYLHVIGLDAKQIVRQLVGAGLIPTEIMPLGSNLEQMFLNLTQ